MRSLSGTLCIASAAERNARRPTSRQDPAALLRDFASRRGLGHELRRRERREGAALVHQRVERAGFDDPALVEHQDEIGVADGGEPMRDDEGGAPAPRRFERLLQPGLGARRRARWSPRRAPGSAGPSAARARSRAAGARRPRDCARARRRSVASPCGWRRDEIVGLRRARARARSPPRSRRACRCADSPRSSARAGTAPGTRRRYWRAGRRSVMSRMSRPSIVMRPAAGSNDAMQQRQRGRLARSGRADERDRAPGRRLESHVARAPRARRHRKSRRPRSGRRRRAARPRPRRGGRRRSGSASSTSKNCWICGAWPNMKLTKPTICSSRPIRSVARLMNATIWPIVVAPCMSSQTPTRKIASSDSVELARVATMAIAHQVSTGNCAREQPLAHLRAGRALRPRRA